MENWTSTDYTTFSFLVGFALFAAWILITLVDKFQKRFGKQIDTVTNFVKDELDLVEKQHEVADEKSNLKLITSMILGCLVLIMFLVLFTPFLLPILILVGVICVLVAIKKIVYFRSEREMKASKQSEK
ncbi:hypothetical protein LMH73_023935 [Vibrio splendidus]|nr:hypothetical protein [Vibrio splendidus]MCC4883194.1 hypothetical protein [Vibrio splendidus]